MNVITVTQVSKAYKQYPTLSARLREWVIGSHKSCHRLHWVLRDINFCLKPGEAMGIVGMNGVGKSTLLKLITKTSQPTSGTITTRGRLSALLELGLGFHPEFTGRQNIFLASQLLGHQRKDIIHLIPEIEAFSEIDNYLDQPLRTYSSGMKVRLAFSVATAVRPDIMIIDEALAIGDSYFQHKCYRRIREFLQQGTALLFVSHDSTAITSICKRAILLHNGFVTMEGRSEEVVNYYQALLADHSEKKIRQQNHHCGKLQTISGTGEASILEVNLYNDQNEPVQKINVGDRVRLNLQIQVHQDLDELTIGYEIKDKYGRPIFGTNTYHLDQKIINLKQGEYTEINFLFAANLGIGEYSISIALHSGFDHIEKNYEWRDLALLFDVTNSDKKTFLGTTWLPPQVKYSRIVKHSIVNPFYGQLDQKSTPIEAQ